MINSKRALHIASAVLAIGVASLALAMSPYDNDSLEIVTESGSTHEFLIEIATTSEEQALGLMYRTSLDPDSGMLFVYATPRETSFWMKNTLIPLDMIFIDEAGTIVKIIANTRPLSLIPRRSSSPVIGVLEINGGRSAELGIQVGDVVEHKALARSSQ